MHNVIWSSNDQDIESVCDGEKVCLLLSAFGDFLCTTGKKDATKLVRLIYTNYFSIEVT